MKMESNDYERRFNAQVKLRVNWLTANLDSVIYEQVTSLDGLQALHFDKSLSIPVPESIQSEMALEKMGAYPRDFRGVISDAYVDHVKEVFDLELTVTDWRFVKVSISNQENS